MEQFSDETSLGMSHFFQKKSELEPNLHESYLVLKYILYLLHIV